jgi:membrane-bound lytic murein transglycosylase
MTRILILIILITLAACGSKKLAVGNADTLISYQMNKRIPLEYKQKEKLAKDVDEFLNVHKADAKAILPIIDEIRLEQPIDAQYSKIEAFYKKVTQDFTKIIAKYMAMLGETQQKEFFESFKAENERSLKRDKFTRRKQVEDRVKIAVGSITEEQKKILDQYEGYFEERMNKRHQMKQELFTKFQEIYKSRTDLEHKFEQAFLAYQAENMDNAKNLEIIKKIIPTLTHDQKEELKDQIVEVKEIIALFLSTNY